MKRRRATSDERNGGEAEVALDAVGWVVTDGRDGVGVAVEKPGLRRHDEDSVVQADADRGDAAGLRGAPRSGVRVERDCVESVAGDGDQAVVADLDG